MIDLGHITKNGLRVDDYFDPQFHYDRPAYWLVCNRGHRVFASECAVETAICGECPKEDEMRREWFEALFPEPEVAQPGDPMKVRLHE